MNNLELLYGKLSKAKIPEEIFGKAPIRPTYLALVKICHVDLNPKEFKKLAAETFELLLKFHLEANKRIELGIYGSKALSPKEKKENPPIVVNSKKFSYTVLKSIGKTETSNLYKCIYGKDKIGVFKIVRSHLNNDLALNEISNLKILDGISFIPSVIDNFNVVEKKNPKRQVTVFPYIDGLFSLKELSEKFTLGLNPETTGWMTNRLFEAMFYFHERNVIHGALLPSNIFYHLKSHSILIQDWSFSVKNGQRLKAIVKDYETWYPPEIKSKLTVSTSLDIFMAVKSLCSLYRKDLHKSILGFFNACLIRNPNRRCNNAGELREEFGEILESLYGKPRFHEFKI